MLSENERWDLENKIDELNLNKRRRQQALDEFNYELNQAQSGLLGMIEELGRSGNQGAQELYEQTMYMRTNINQINNSYAERIEANWLKERRKLEDRLEDRSWG